MNVNKPISFVILFVILGIPVLLTFCLNSGKNHYQKLPFLGPKKVTENNDTAYHQIDRFALINEKGDTIEIDEELRGKPFIAHFFSVDCKGRCSETFEYLHKVKARLQSKSEFQILSIAIDGTDHLSQLRDFRTAQNIEEDRWHLLTGEPPMVKNLATKSFLVTVDENQNTNSPVVHSDVITLVDTNRHIRGFYKGSDWNEVEKLMEELIVLKVNEERS